MALFSKLSPTPSMEKNFRLLLGVETLDQSRVLLAEDAYELVMSWIFPAIMCALELDDPPRTVSQLARRLGENEAAIAESVVKLEKFGILNVDHEGQIRSNKVFFKTTEDIPNRFIRGFHLEGLDKAREALLRVPVEQREFQGVTFEGSSELFVQLKDQLRTFRDEVVAGMQIGSKDQVYRMNIQVWPLLSEEAERIKGAG